MKWLLLCFGYLIICFALQSAGAQVKIENLSFAKALKNTPLSVVFRSAVKLSVVCDRLRRRSK